MSAGNPALHKKAKENMPRRIVRLVGLLLVLAFFGWSFVAVGFSPLRLAGGVPDLLNLVADMFPPALGNVPEVAVAALETLQMALIGTALAAVMSVPLAFLAAKNVAPSAVLYQITRAFIVFTRAVPDLIFALIFVAAVGLGPFPGTLAIAIHSIGMLGKLYAESIEEIDPGQVEAMKSTGARPLQVLAFGVVPQVLPSFVGLTLYRWDINIRSSVVLGLVGAGGIGFLLTNSMRLFKYQEVATILVSIFIIVLIVEQVSSHIRARFI